MHGAYETFKEAGFIAWLIVLVGLLGLAASLGAVIVTAMRSRVALWIGAAAVILGALAAGLGGLGVVRGRSVTEAAIAGESLMQSRIVTDTPGMVETLQKDLQAMSMPTEAPEADPLNPTNKGPKPAIRMGALTVSGRLPPEVIQRIIRQNFGRFRLCYTVNAKGRPLEGTVKARFVIGRDGAVNNVGSAGSTLSDPAIESCVIRALYGLSFPQPEDGIVVVVSPITFSPPSAPKP